MPFGVFFPIIVYAFIVFEIYFFPSHLVITISTSSRYFNRCLFCKGNILLLKRYTKQQLTYYKFFMEAVILQHYALCIKILISVVVDNSLSSGTAGSLCIKSISLL